MGDLRGRGRWLFIRALVRLTLLLTATTRVYGEEVADACYAPEAVSAAPATPAVPAASGGPERVEPPAPPLMVRITVKAEPGTSGAAGPSYSFFGRDSLEGRPAALGDPFRALAGTAGIDSRNDFTSEVRVRGGETSDTTILMDGLPLPAPFHFAGSPGSATALTGDQVDRVEVRTGGFSVEFGDAVAGVLDLTTRDEHPARMVGRAGISTAEGHATLSGPVGEGSWTVSGRASDLGLYGDRAGADGIEQVRFHDLFTALRLPLPGPGRLDVALLEDGNDYGQDLGGGIHGGMNSGQHGARARFETPLGGRSFFKASVAEGTVTTHSSVTGGARYDQIQDRGDLKLSLLRLVGAAHRLSMGLDLSRTRGSIDGTVADAYILLPQSVDDRARTTGVFLEDVSQPGERWSLRYGARADRFSVTGESVLSPRVGFDFRPVKGLAFRGALGRFVQFPRPEQLFLAAGEPLRSQVADHAILGFEGSLPGGTGLVVEGYRKWLRDPIGETINRYIDLPEQMTRFDGGRVDGLDVTLERPAVGAWRFRVDYSYMVARQELNGVLTPRNTDQRHTASASLGRGFGRGWDLSALLRYGSGLPYTPQTPWTDGIDYGARLGELNSARLPIYHRLDLRLGRALPFSRGLLSWHLDLLNLYDRHNVRNIDLIFDARKNAFYRITDYQSPFLAVFGVTAEF